MRLRVPSSSRKEKLTHFLPPPLAAKDVCVLTALTYEQRQSTLFKRGGKKRKEKKRLLIAPKQTRKKRTLFLPDNNNTFPSFLPFSLSKLTPPSPSPSRGCATYDDFLERRRGERDLHSCAHRLPLSDAFTPPCIVVVIPLLPPSFHPPIGQ